MYWNNYSGVIRLFFSSKALILIDSTNSVDFRGKMRRRWLNYEAHEEAYLGNSAFIR